MHNCYRVESPLLRDPKTLLWKTFTSIREAMFIIDVDDVIVDCNPAATEMFGYSHDEIVGKNAIFLHVNELSLAEFKAIVYRAIDEKGFFYLPEFKMRRKKGEVFFTEHSVVPIESDDGKRIGRVSLVRDITNRKEAENKIRTALNQKELLIKEIHHRVKNNLQLVSSLITLAEDEAKTERQQSILSDTVSRIHAISMVHEHVYSTNDLSKIDLSEYLSDLVHYLKSLYATKLENIQIELEIEPATVDLSLATPIALITSEIINNSVKHAFPNPVSGKIRLEAHRIDPRTYELKISDNGIGMDAAAERNKSRKKPSLGLQLIPILAKQINAVAETINENEQHGWTIRIPLRSAHE